MKKEKNKLTTIIYIPRLLLPPLPPIFAAPLPTHAEYPCAAKYPHTNNKYVILNTLFYKIHLHINTKYEIPRGTKYPSTKCSIPSMKYSCAINALAQNTKYTCTT